MMNKTFQPAKAAVAFALALSAFSATALPTRAAQTPAEALQLLASSTSGALVSAVKPIDAYATVQALPGKVLLADDSRAAPLLRAQDFIARFGVLSGVSDALNQLVVTRINTDRAGNTHVHLNQVQNGLAVFGARLVVHMNNAGITGMNGAFIPGLESLSTTPKMGIVALRERGIAATRKLYPNVANLGVESTRLMFYRTGLLKGVAAQANYLAYEVMVRGGDAAFPVRERVILDAHTGAVLNRINEIHTVLNREIYTPVITTPPVITEGSALAPADLPLVLDDRTATSTRVPLALPTPLIPLNNLYVFAGGTYDLYKNLAGREGYDDGSVPPEMQVQKSVYLVNENCPNAYWDGQSTNYCPAFDADDIVSHEWSHAYTEFTSGLVYQYQSGALNEGYSDIYGETYDLVNGIEGPLGFTLTEGEYFENQGSRWVLGEDLSETAAGALLRDMWDPDNFGVNVPFLGIEILSTPSPGSVITSANYYCLTGDNGGVHINSGVPNHAYAMLVDGKEFNNVVIPKIGMTKAAQIYFQAQSVYQTPTTNFNQHADALEKSCMDLTGKPLTDVLGNVSTEVITAADCAAVTAAIAATEMRMPAQMKCNYQPVLKPEAATPALCPSGEFVFPTFKETWESGAIPASWTQTKNITGDFDSPTFVYSISSALPAPHTGKALFAANDGEGTCAAGGDASGTIRIDSPELTVPEAASFLSFTHFMQSEALFDGGNLLASVNGGAFTLVPAASYTFNPYNLPLEAAATNTNPKATEMAWTGSDQGEATGSWGTTVVDIASLGAAKSDKIRFRWEFGQDGCGGNLGWVIDDTQLFYCSKTAPASTTPDNPTTPGGGSTPPIAGEPTPGTSPVSGDVGRFGGGALGWLALLPLAAAGLRRRRRTMA